MCSTPSLEQYLSTDATFDPPDYSRIVFYDAGKDRTTLFLKGQPWKICKIYENTRFDFLALFNPISALADTVLNSKTATDIKVKFEGTKRVLLFKGTVAWDFCSLVFFSNRPHLCPCLVNIFFLIRRVIQIRNLYCAMGHCGEPNFFCRYQRFKTWAV